MEGVLFLKDYIRWHYGAGIIDLLRVWRNFLWFIPHAFSFRTLLFTLFSPWRRLSEKTETGFHPEKFFENLIVNTIMRFVGFIARFFLFLAGSISLLATLLLGVVLLFAWVFAPAVLLLLLTIGLKLIL